MGYKELFEKELEKYGVTWCKGECGLEGHKRGFVLVKDRRTIHFDSEIATRSTLHGALHELGHCVNNESGLRSYECEAKAEEFATKKMREMKVPVPRKVIARGKDYVRRKKRHGENIRRAKNGV